MVEKIPKKGSHTVNCDVSTDHDEPRQQEREEDHLRNKRMALPWYLREWTTRTGPPSKSIAAQCPHLKCHKQMQPTHVQSLTYFKSSLGYL